MKECHAFKLYEQIPSVKEVHHNSNKSEHGHDAYYAIDLQDQRILAVCEDLEQNPATQPALAKHCQLTAVLHATIIENDKEIIEMTCPPRSIVRQMACLMR